MVKNDSLGSDLYSEFLDIRKTLGLLGEIDHFISGKCSVSEISGEIRKNFILRSFIQIEGSIVNGDSKAASIRELANQGLCREKAGRNPGI